jgi:YVTN family beta-propeller protein
VDNNPGATVAVISGRTNTVTATVPVGSGPLWIAANPRTNTIYVTHPGGTVAVISGRTNTVTATVPVGRFPDKVAVNPRTNTIYVTNTDSGTVSVINGRTNTVVATIPVGLGPVGSRRTRGPTPSTWSTTPAARWR